MIGRPGHWSERGEYNILFLGSMLVISSQDSSALEYREFTQEGPMTINPFATREGTSAPQWPNVKKCCRHLVPSSDFFVQSYAVPMSESVWSHFWVTSIIFCVSAELGARPLHNESLTTHIPFMTRRFVLRRFLALKVTEMSDVTLKGPPKIPFLGGPS